MKPDFYCPWCDELVRRRVISDESYSYCPQCGFLDGYEDEFRVLTEDGELIPWHTEDRASTTRSANDSPSTGPSATS